MCQRKFRPIKYTCRYSYAKFRTFFWATRYMSGFVSRMCGCALQKLWMETSCSWTTIFCVMRTQSTGKIFWLVRIRKWCTTAAQETWLVNVSQCSSTVVWLSVWSEVQIVCIWFSWCHCHPQTPSSLASFKSIPDWFTFLVPAYPGCPGKEAVKWV